MNIVKEFKNASASMKRKKRKPRGTIYKTWCGAKKVTASFSSSLGGLKNNRRENKACVQL